MKILDFNGLKLFSNKIKEKLTDKQDILVSGDNIATINGASLLEGGNIIIPTSPFTSGTGGDSAVSNVDIGCEASGQGSFATGIYAKAKGQGSIALGRYCESSGKGSVSLGGLLLSIKLTGEANSLTYKVNSPTTFYTKNPEVLIGISIVSAVTDGTNTPLATITGSVLLETGELQITTDKALSSKSINSVTYYLSAAKAIGNAAVSIGSAWQASGDYSVVLGRSAAFGQFSTAIGSENAAFGQFSTAIGKSSVAKGRSSVSLGLNCNALNTASVAIGNQTTASGMISFSTGTFTTASGNASYSGGGGMWNFYISGDGTDNSYQITKGSNWQFVEDLEKLPGSMLYNAETGQLAAVIDSYTLGEDGYTITVVLDRSLGTLDDSKFVIPLGKAEGEYSHSQNGGTKASGDYSISSGVLTIAVGEASSAFGDRTISRGNKSSTFGEHTFTTNSGEFALGVSNISHTGETKDSQTLLSVGIGSEGSELDMETRIKNQIPFTSMQDGKNALEIMRNGDIWFGEYNNGIKAYDNITKTTPFIEKSSEGSDKVILGDGSLKALSEVEDSRYSQFVEAVSDNGFMPTENFFINAFFTDYPEDGVSTLNFHNNVDRNAIGYDSLNDTWEETLAAAYIDFPYATQDAAGVMSAADKTKLDGIATGANKYTLPNATSSTLGGVKIGSNISVTGDGTISLTKDNVTAALGYTPPTTNTTYGVVTEETDGLMCKGTYAALNGGFVLQLLDAEASEDYMQLYYNYASPNDDGTFEMMKGESVSIPLATTTTAGVMSAADKTKLDIYDYSREDYNGGGDITERLVWNITEDPDASCIHVYEQRIEKDDNYIVTHFDVSKDGDGNKHYNNYVEVGDRDNYTSLSPMAIEGYFTDGKSFYIDGNRCEAEQFVKHDGTATQILMADGSVKEISEISGDSGYSQFIEAAANLNEVTIPTADTFSGQYTWDEESGYMYFATGGNGLLYVGNGEWLATRAALWLPDIPVATTTSGGVMSPADKQTLEELKQQMSNINLILEYIINS